MHSKGSKRHIPTFKAKDGTFLFRSLLAGCVFGNRQQKGETQEKCIMCVENKWVNEDNDYGHNFESLLQRDL